MFQKTCANHLLKGGTVVSAVASEQEGHGFDPVKDFVALNWTQLKAATLIYESIIN